MTDDYEIIDINGICVQEKADANTCIQNTSKDLCSSCYGDNTPHFNDYYEQDLNNQFLRTQSFMVDIHNPKFCSVANDRMCQYFMQHNSCCCAQVVQSYRKCLFDKVLIPNLPKNEAGYAVTCKDTCDYHRSNKSAAGEGNDEQGNNNDGQIMAIVGAVFAILVVLTVAIAICCYKNMVKKNKSIIDAAQDDDGTDEKAGVTSVSSRTRDTVDIEQSHRERAVAVAPGSSPSAVGVVAYQQSYQQKPEKYNGRSNVRSSSNNNNGHRNVSKNNNVVDVESGGGGISGKNNPILQSSSNALMDMNEMDNNESGHRGKNGIMDESGRSGGRSNSILEDVDFSEHVVEESIKGLYDDDDEALFLESNAIINQAAAGSKDKGGGQGNKPKRPEQRGAYETAATKQELEVSALKLEILKLKKQKIHEWRAARRRGSNESLEDYLSDDDDDKLNSKDTDDQEMRHHSYDL